MSSVFSKPQNRQSHIVLPADVLIEITSYLRPRDQGAMLTCCWTMHDIIAPLFYRHLDAWFQPPAWEASDGYDHTPYRLLTTLASSSRHANIPWSTRCYARYVVTFAYVSYGKLADFRAIPLFTEFLRFAVRLRHLRIDVMPPSVPLVLDHFRRHSIICAPPPSFAAVYTNAASISPWILPSLESVRSSKASLVESLMRYRGIRTAVIDAWLSTPDMDILFSMSTFLRQDQLMRLSLSVSDPATYQGVLRAVTLSFPRLQHLSIRTSIQLAAPAFLFMLEARHLGGLSMSHLQGLGFNHAGYGNEYTHTLQESEALIVEAGKEWPALQMVILGDAMWSRTASAGSWQFSVDTVPGAWSWLVNINAGMWASPRLP